MGSRPDCTYPHFKISLLSVHSDSFLTLCRTSSVTVLLVTMVNVARKRSMPASETLARIMVSVRSKTGAISLVVSCKFTDKIIIQ